MKDEDKDLWGGNDPVIPPPTKPQPELKPGDEFTANVGGEEVTFVVSGETKEQRTSRLAKEIIANQVFTTEHIRESDRHLASMIFMPILLGGGYTKEQLAQIGMIYAYYKDTFPRSLNGYPLFHACYTLGIEETKMVWEKVARIQSAIENATK